MHKKGRSQPTQHVSTHKLCNVCDTVNNSMLQQRQEHLIFNFRCFSISIFFNCSIWPKVCHRCCDANDLFAYWLMSTFTTLGCLFNCLAKANNNEDFLVAADLSLASFSYRFVFFVRWAQSQPIFLFPLNYENVLECVRQQTKNVTEKTMAH